MAGSPTEYVCDRCGEAVRSRMVRCRRCGALLMRAQDVSGRPTDSLPVRATEPPVDTGPTPRKSGVATKPGFSRAGGTSGPAVERRRYGSRWSAWRRSGGRLPQPARPRARMLVAAGLLLLAGGGVWLVFGSQSSPASPGDGLAPRVRAFLDTCLASGARGAADFVAPRDRDALRVWHERLAPAWTGEDVTLEPRMRSAIHPSPTEAHVPVDLQAGRERRRVLLVWQWRDGTWWFDPQPEVDLAERRAAGAGLPPLQRLP